MTEMESGGIIMSGYLLKSPPESKLRNLRSWTKRYFVLYANKLLSYYKNEKEKRPVKEPIKLTHCKFVESNLNHEKFKFVFSIVTDQRIYYLVADSQLEMETWVEKLIKVCGFRRTDQNQSLDMLGKMNAHNNLPAHPRPITTATKHNAMSPVGTAPSSFSSSGSSLTSPTGPCPLSIPKHIMDNRNKQRSISDPPEYLPENPQLQHQQMRRQSEQVGSPTSSISVQGIQKARLSGYLPETHDLQRPVSSHDVYDNLPSPKKVSQAISSPELDDVPVPQPCDPASNLSSPRRNSGHHLTPDDYDAVPTPRPVSQASSRSSQDIYDLVPPPRPTSSCSQDGQSLYDIPPSGRNQENYSTVPSPQRSVVPSDNLQQNYDVVTMRHSPQSMYDVVPPERAVEEENYDIVPRVSRLVAPKLNHFQPGNPQENYDVIPKRDPSIYDFPPSGRASYQENYDIVPPACPVVPKPNQFQQGESKELYDIVPRRETPHKMHNGQSAYDNLPNERASTQENYDVVPRIHKPVFSKPGHGQAYTSQENYDVVPIPRRTSENYDIVPPPRATATENQPGNSDFQPHFNGHDHRFSDIYSVPPKLQSPADVDEWLSAPPRPAPYRPSKDAYDSLPNTNRPVSADSGLNASFTSICSLKGEGDDRYDAPLPALPNSRDSGSLSDDSPDDDMNPNEIYDRPPSWEAGDSIYDIPPKQESIYDVLPKHTEDIYDTPPSRISDFIYDVPPNHNAVPVVDRSTKRPPQVNRANKPRAPTGQDHHYCNMAPPVDRESKHKRSTMPQPEPSYVNFGVSPQRPQNLPLMKTLTGNSFVGSLPHKSSQWSGGLVDDLDYCPMQAPTRSEMTRCYSYTKADGTSSRSVDNDQCYEDMSALQTRRDSCGKSNSSSLSSLADNDDLYIPMGPTQMEQRHRRDLLYAEVEIVEGVKHARIPTNVPPRRENTNYTFINEESTRALLETSHAWQGFR